MRGSRSFRSKLPAISRPSIFSFHYWWRHLAVQVGRTKDQGLYNKPSAAGHPGALAAGTLPHNITKKIYTQTRSVRNTKHHVGNKEPVVQL